MENRQQLFEESFDSIMELPIFSLAEQPAQQLALTEVTIETN